MSRYPHPYRQTCDGDNSCGCCEPVTDQAESDDSALLMPENLTPEQRLLWAIFGKQPPEQHADSNQEADCGDNDL